MSQTTEQNQKQNISIRTLANKHKIRPKQVKEVISKIDGIEVPTNLNTAKFSEAEAEKIDSFIKQENISNSNRNTQQKPRQNINNGDKPVSVSEISKELGRRPRDVFAIIKQMGDMTVPENARSAIFSIEEAEKIVNYSKTYQPNPNQENRTYSNDMNRDNRPNRHNFNRQNEVRHVKGDNNQKERSDRDRNSDQNRRNGDSNRRYDRSNESNDFRKDGNRTNVQNRQVSKNTENKTTSSETNNSSPEIASSGLRPRRTGLKIVKKNKKPQPKRSFDYQLDDTPKSSYNRKTSSGESLAEIAERKAQKTRERNKKSNIQKQKKDAGNKLNIFEERDFNIDNSFYQEPEKEIVLIDFRDETNDSFREEHEDATSKKQKNNKTNNNNNNKRGGNQRGGGHRNLVRNTTKRKRRRTDDSEKEVITSVEIPEDIRVYEFAEKTNREVSEIIKVLFTLGEMVTKNDFLNKDKIDILAEEFGIEVKTVDLSEEYNYAKQYEEIEEEEEYLLEKAPVVTIMGHVDHGKTSLLDRIRNDKVNIAEKEAGGITQHIGAYTIEHNNKSITFIDTPGHEAFSHMRKRGSEVTDVIIIVVAGDDGVKPQTKEAIKHAQDSGAPIIVAVNKMDKENANLDMVKAQVAELNLTPIDWGGDTEFISISAKSGMGIDELLETILIQAEVLELKANPDRQAYATVIESSLEKGRGPVATVIVKNGTLAVGDTIVAGASYGRVRALLDDLKQPIKSVLPGGTAVVVGLDQVPPSGEDLVATKNEKEAKELAEKRRAHDRHKSLSESTKSTLEDLTSKIAEGQLKNLKVILKADVHGSLEAIKNTLVELRNDEVKVSLIHSSVGGITENDIILAGDSEDTIILGFNVRPTGTVKEMAKQKNVRINTYSVIYKLIDDVTAVLEGMMSPVIEEENTGQAEVKQVFKLSKGILVAGCMVSDGTVIRGGYARLIRNGVVIAETTIHTLKRFKDDVNEVKRGFECGIGLHNVEDIREHDYIETFKKIEKQAQL